MIIDIEASGLGRHSFPIQLAWSSPNGDCIGSHFILPVAEWTEWDEEAIELHRVDLGHLERYGVTAEDTVAAFESDRQNQAVYSDAPAFDEFWLTRLYQAAGYERAPKVHHIVELAVTERQQAAHAELETAYRKHNALADVEDLVQRLRGWQ